MDVLSHRAWVWIVTQVCGSDTCSMHSFTSHPVMSSNPKPESQANNSMISRFELIYIPFYDLLKVFPFGHFEINLFGCCALDDGENGSSV